MTERTVTIQTEEEQTITLCDQCGLSDDAGEIINYGPWQREKQEEYDHLHLHRGCIEDMGVDVPDMPTFEDTLLNRELDLKAPVLAFPRIGIVFVAASYLFIGFGAYEQDLALLGPGLLLIVFNYALGYSSANKTMEQMKND